MKVYQLFSVRLGKKRGEEDVRNKRTEGLVFTLKDTYKHIKACISPETINITHIYIN